MGVKTLITFPYQFAVEAFFAPARLVSRHEQNRPAAGMKDESHSPFTIRHAESQFLHVRGALSGDRVNAVPKLLHKERQRHNPTAPRRATRPIAVPLQPQHI